MNSRIIFVGIILLQLFIQLGQAQNPDLKFTLIEGPDGKPLGKIRNVTQDPHGYMWFAGEDAHCIYRYDGTKITAFKHDESNPNSLGGNFVNSVYSDKSGIIWIGLNEGLDRFDTEKGVFKHFRNDPNDPSSLSVGVNPVLKDSQGRLWVGTDNGLDLLDEKTGKFIHYRHEPDNPRSLSSNRVVNIYEDRQGVIWIGTNFPWQSLDPDEGGLNRLEADGTFTQYKHDPKNPHSLINNKVRAIFEDSRGVFWVGTGGDGLHTMDRKTGRFERHTFDPARPDKLSRPSITRGDSSTFKFEQITFIQEDAVGSIWIGTMWNGLNRYDTLTKKITHYYSSGGFPDQSGWNAYQSRDGVLWISTQEENLYRIDPFFKTLKRTSTTNMPLGFVDDNEGNLWVGTEAGGFLQYDQLGTLRQQFKHNPSNKFSLFDTLNTVLSMSYDTGDTIWVGTSDGPGFFNKATKQFSRLPIVIKYNPTLVRNVPDVMEDSQGLLWFVLNGSGLLRYNSSDNSFKHYLHDEKDSTSLTSDHIVTVFEDSNGVIWAGDFAGGINRLDRSTETFRHYMKGTPSYGMYETSDGSLWAGSNSGLLVYDPNEDRFNRFLDAESEVSKLPFTKLVEDGKNNLWQMNPSMLFKLNLATSDAFIYATKYGIPTNSIHPLAFYKDRKGQFRVGNNNGFYTFYPEELAVNVQPMKVVVTNFYLNNIPVSSGEQGFLTEPIEKVTALVLPYNQNNIGFDFAAIDYRAPEAIKYFTMLEGYDNTWREAKGEKSSYYFNVPPGKYTYRIKSFNGEGTKGEKLILVHITPPLWRTWWAYSTYGLFFIGAIWAIHRYQRQRVIRSERERAQEKELAQAKEIEKAYTDLKATQALLIQSEKMASLGELTAGIAHEIQNPLNFVNNFSEVNTELIEEAGQEIEKGNISELKTILNDIKENEQKINHHGKRADAIVKGMLQHSRTSSGVKEPTDINALADEYLRLAYHGLRAKDKSFNGTMNTNFDQTIGNVNVIPQDIGRVMLNLITNAFYAVAEKKKLNIENLPAARLPDGQGQAGYEPTVTVSTKLISSSIADKWGRVVEIKVKDNGKGIPYNALDKIFQPFFTTKPTGHGTGLGLSLSYDIIKAHGGELNVETREGEYAEFIIKLPYLP